MVVNIHVMLHKAMKTAVQEHLIPSNPTIKTVRPKIAKKYKDEQFESLTGRPQPFNAYSQEDLETLAKSIYDQGVINPITVRPMNDGKYQILAGRNRTRAAKIAGKTEMPCIVRDDIDDVNAVLLSISLNSVSKWTARVLPSFKDYCKNKNELPKLITFSFAALLAFYSSNNLKEDGLYAKRANGDEYVIHDDKAVLQFFTENTGKADFVELACKNVDFWGEDLSKYYNFTEEVVYFYERLMTNAKDALKEVLA